MANNDVVGQIKSPAENIAANDDQFAEKVNPAKKFAFDSFQAIRKRLLDLSNRNTLLNFAHRKTNCIRLVDELPDQIYTHLREGNKFTFLPVPEPTEEELISAGYINIDLETNQRTVSEHPSAEQWAKYLGFATSYDLPEANSGSHHIKHQDTNLQSLLYAPELESKLRGIRVRAESSIQESGSNILFLALGFLEWYENRESDIRRLSPLFTLPVRLVKTGLDKKSGAYKYTIELKDDNLISNNTLQEKLNNDFDLILSSIEDDATPESYYQKIKETIIRHQPRWKIRRQASLVLLNFAKQVMYKDIDPKNWPANWNIERHPLVKKFFMKQDETDSGVGYSYEPEHSLDQIDNIHEQFPLIYDADSSQHSAIIDAVSGKNLVIEGPPGSGKSQTITNIIAACIANGQKVLFVAEKMEALNVVKKRLDQADLGDFCLEIHSHKTNKQKILNDLSTRLSKQDVYTSPHSFDTDINRYEGLKNKLNEYVFKINSLWANTGSTKHQILQKATRLREKYNINPDSLRIEGLNGEDITPAYQSELTDHAYTLGSVYEHVSEQARDGQIRNHYWYGVQNVDLNSIQIEELANSLKSWSESLLNLDSIWNETLKNHELEQNGTNSLSEIRTYINAGLKLPPLLGGELLDKLEIVFQKNNEIEVWLNTYEELHSTTKKLKSIAYNDALSSKSTAQSIFSALRTLSASGIPGSHTLGMLADDRTNLLGLVEKSNEIEESLNSIHQNAPSELKSLFLDSTNNLIEITKFIRQIEKLPPKLWRYRDEVFDNSDLDSLIELLIPHINKIAPIHNKLKDEVNLNDLPNIETLKNHQSVLDNVGFFKWFSSNWRLTRKLVLNLSKKTKPNKKLFINLLPEINSYAEEQDKIFRIYNENPILGSHFQGVETPIEQISELRNWYKSVREEYGIKFGERTKIGNALLKLEKEFAVALLDEASKGFQSNIELLLGHLQYFRDKYPNHSLSKNNDQPILGNYGQLKKLASVISHVLGNLQSIFKKKELSLDELSTYKHLIESLQRDSDNWANNELIEIIKPFGKQFALYPSDFSSNHLAIAKNTIEISKLTSKSSYLNAALRKSPSEVKYQQILAGLTNLHKESQRENQEKEYFATKGSVNLDCWLETIDDSIVNIVTRNNDAINHENWINNWLDYARLKKRLHAQGFRNIIHALEASNIEGQDLEEIASLAINHQLAKEIFSKHPDLANFSGLEQTANQQRFKQYDAKILKLQRKRIAFNASRTNPPIGISSGRIKDFSEVSLIRHEANKARKHIAVRSLIKRAGSAIQALKPCFMMSPMSVAQYLEPGRFKFDLIIMDEASQIRPEDALGSIARGSRLLVVGDPKQLPPTNFFQKILQEDSEDELVGLQDTDSILESVMPMFSTRRLRWHYRSKHESLIAFSNKHFYDSNLVLFPSPFRVSHEFGIKLNHIQRGRFVENRNVEEAQELVKFAANHLIDHPEETLGIAAMNVEQRDEIEKQLDQLAKDNPALLKAYETNRSSVEPLFIKNLESVQGDERDVIYISMTYGPEQIGGRTMQRFGPINRDDGWKRLNVLFTRSKKRMHIFSSMTSGDILVSPESSKGVKALKAFLEYTETGHLHHTVSTGRAPENDFELSVIRILEMHGYECEPQLGVAGFFLDVAVRDPGKPGRYLMGIECDGATYHSAKSARDRDLLRQEILENLGWKIKRIWSTDWFKHPQAQIQPILNALEELKTPITQEAELVNTEINKIDIEDISKNAVPIEQPEQLSEIEDIDITERLKSFDQSIIRIEFPKTEESQRLLRTEMLDILVEKLPTSKAEFHEYMPAYLRMGTATQEAKHLDTVLEIIANFA